MSLDRKYPGTSRVIAAFDLVARKFSRKWVGSNDYFLALLLEESEEFWDEVKKKNPSVHRLDEEAIDVLVLLMRYTNIRESQLIQIESGAFNPTPLLAPELAIRMRRTIYSMMYATELPMEKMTRLLEEIFVFVMSNNHRVGVPLDERATATESPRQFSKM